MDGRTHVRRLSGERYIEAYVHGTVVWGGGSVMALGTLSTGA